jgi:NAD(P)-dependent dehydrogenase (short-subunit alcohol dehydrogenase family)
VSDAPELDGTVCVVTGAGRGIGAAIAEKLASHGGRIAILDRDAGLAADTERVLNERGAEARAYEVDVTEEAGVVRVAREIASDFGSVGVLVNNAGIGILGPSMTFPLADWQAQLDVMATGVFLSCREFGKVLRGGGGGTIVNISSINGITAFPMRLAYSAAKAAVISMTKVLAVEWAPYAIRVNAVAPGNTRTGLFELAVSEGHIDLEAYMDHTPLRRLAEPEEIAETVLYLASPRSSYLTGQVIVPDGGWTAFGWIPWTGVPEAPGTSVPEAR